MNFEDSARNYKNIGKKTVIKVGSRWFYRQEEEQPRPQGFSLKIWVLPHPFFKRNAALGTTVGRRNPQTENRLAMDYRSLRVQ